MFDWKSALQNLGVSDAICLDTEYQHTDGEHVVSVCLVARSMFTGQDWRLIAEPGQDNPLPMDESVLYVTFAAHAEWSYFLAMGWTLPTTIIDLYAERMMATREERDHTGKMVYPSLLSSMMHYGLDAMSAVHKTEMRELIMRGNPDDEHARNEFCNAGVRPYTPDQAAEILEYCNEDVVATEKLFAAMFTELAERLSAEVLDTGPDEQPAPTCAGEIFDDKLREVFGQWIHRGNFTRVVAYWEFNGIPVDVAAYERLVANRTLLQNRVIKSVEAEYEFGVYAEARDGHMVFKKAEFNALVTSNGLAGVWPLAPSGNDFSSRDEDFKEMAQRFPALKPLYDVRKFVTTLRSFELFIGKDGRSRVFPNPFHTNTGRNNPRNSNFIFSLPKWARPLMQPGPGRALIYSDLKSAEIGIAAGLSRDPNMMKNYSDSLKPGGDDCYIGFAKLAKAVPPDGTKKSHPRERELYKSSFLGANYGQTPEGFAIHSDLPLRVAQAVHAKHHEIYATWWGWIENEILTAGVLGHMDTRWGWVRQVSTEDAEANTLLNFPIQAGGAEILRLASGYMLDEGLILCACVHDAVLIECAIGEEDAAIKICDGCWKRASAAYLDGFELGSDYKIIRYPDRWGDNHEENEKDVALWEKIQTSLGEIDGQ